MRRFHDPPLAYRSAAPAAGNMCTMLLFAFCNIAIAAEAVPEAPGGVPEFHITGEVIAGGGMTRARSACFDLAATIAEPVVGTVAGGAFSVTAGFWSDPASTDSIFRSSFESCQP